MQGSDRVQANKKSKTGTEQGRMPGDIKERETGCLIGPG